MPKPYLTRWLAALMLLALPACACAGEDISALKDRLLASDAGSSLDQAGLKPWHMKIAVQLSDAKGKPTEQATIEEWWNGPDEHRIDYASPSYTATEIQKQGDHYRSDGVGSAPYYLDLLRRQMVHPMASAADLAAAVPVLQKQKFGKAQLECIMLTQPIKNLTDKIPLGLFPTYCFEEGQTNLRASFAFGGQLLIRNGGGIFQGKHIATDVAVNADGVVAASSHLVMLRAEPISDDTFATGSGVTPLDVRSVQVGGGTVAGRLLHKEDPVYPASAKAAHISGTVILRAAIGSDGHIHSLRIVSTPDPDLAISAIAAVRKWTYKPYLLNGAPTDVDTTITVNYTFGN